MKLCLFQLEDVASCNSLVSYSRVESRECWSFYKMLTVKWVYYNTCMRVDVFCA